MIWNPWISQGNNSAWFPTTILWNWNVQGDSISSGQLWSLILEFLEHFWDWFWAILDHFRLNLRPVIYNFLKLIFDHFCLILSWLVSNNFRSFLGWFLAILEQFLSSFKKVLNQFRPILQHFWVSFGPLQIIFLSILSQFRPTFWLVSSRNYWVTL